jgi:UDP-N-acetylmuramyl pentapeptide synthase
VVFGKPMRSRLDAQGRQMGMSALAVRAARSQLQLQLPLAGAIESLARFEAPDSRGVPHTVAIRGGSFRLIDEAYDADPASMRAALELLAHAPCEPAKRVAILGDMLQPGPDAERHHLALEPQLLASQPDRVLLCGPLMGALHARIRTKLRSR